MPELPEVENVCRGLEKTILDSPIQKIHWFRPDIRFPLPVKDFKKLQNTKVNSVRRRAKYLLFELGESTMINHLGMTGVWRWDDLPNPDIHDHVALEFSGGRYLVYNDPRRFGFFDWVPSSQLNHCRWLAHLGPEPLESGFTPLYLFEISRQKKAPVKNFLMDQKNVVGVGNIYASEALFLAGISPHRQAGQLSQGDCEGLVEAIQEVLSLSIENGGTTLKDFRNVYGELGTNDAELFVYGREGDFCHMCGYLVAMQVMAGRSSFWCPQCQSN